MPADQFLTTRQRLYLCLTAASTLLFACDSGRTPSTGEPTTLAEHSPPASSELQNPDLQQQLQGSSGGTAIHPGAKLYESHCASCHNTGLARAPALNIMQLLSPEAMHSALESGVMKQQAAALTAEQRTEVVEFLVGKPDLTPLKLDHCEHQANWFDYAKPPTAKGWGVDANNSRHVPAAHGQVGANDLGALKIKWVFEYPRATRARSHPSFAGGAVFVGSQNGYVYALDQTSGCVRWAYPAGAEVRTGITIKDWMQSANGAPIGYFADVLARVHAVNLTTGEPVWRALADEHPNATTTAQPVLFEDHVIQPVSSLEVVPAADPTYPCCTFRGSLVTLNANTGEEIRRTYTIAQAPVEVAKNNVGTAILAPSGAPVWNTPTIDTKLRRMYFGTGENYSSPAESHSDAIIAVSLDTGKVQWVRQTTEGDAWNLACMPFIHNQTNCPKERGPDVDFGAPPILIEQAGQRILVAGQKSGDVYGIDPNDGALIWQEKIGRGGNQGGMHFGMAAIGDTVFVPIADYTDESLSAADARPGVYAVNAFTGKRLWSHPAPDKCGDRVDCDPGISAAISAIDGAVLAGHMDGFLRAYDTRNGELLWEFDATQKFTTTTGTQASGGSFGGATAPVAHDGMLFLNSGYGIYFHMPGNVLIAFEKVQ